MKILGFDLGDGESAVTLLQDESAIEPRVLAVQGRTSLLSAVGTRAGRVVVGEEASVLRGAQDVRVRFKSRYLTDPAAAADVRAFAQGVMAELLRDDPALMAEVTRTVAGCPAGWGEVRRAQYAALLESAGFPNVHIVPEPRAAFLYARHARGLRVDAALMRESALVVDIGSSTTDFAYIVDGHQQALSVFGDANLGGGLLDELILARGVRTSPDGEALAAVMAKSPAWRSYCELEARRLKEKYFLSEETWRTKGVTREVSVCYDDTLALRLSLDGAQMEEIIRTPVPALGGKSFVQCLTDALSAAKAVSASRPPKVVLLTGGASRMAFFQQACREAFPDALLVLCPEPECSIARGLAYAGRVDERLRVFRTEVASLARGERLAAAVAERIHALYTPLAHALYLTAQESTLRAVSQWRRGTVATIDELDDQIAKEIAKAFASDRVAARFEPDLREWLDELMQALDGELRALCTRCGVPPEQMTLGGAQVDAGLGGVQISLMDAMGMDILSGTMGVILAVIGASICGGGGVALVGAGPLGMMAGAAAGVLLAIVGKAGMEKALRRAKLPLLMRQLVTDDAVRRGLRRQREDIERALVRALADPANGFQTRLCQSLANTLGAQMERMARDAEMQVCA